MMTRPVLTNGPVQPVGSLSPLEPITTNRRQMLVVGAALAGMIALGTVGRADAQDATPQAMGFSDTKLSRLGYPELLIRVGPDGVVAPAELVEGWYLVTFSAPAPYIGYLDFMQPPAGLDTETATALALDAGRNDMAQMDWRYAGGTNTFVLDEPVSFAIRLAPGDYQVAASYYLPEQGSEEIMKLSPLSVTPAGDATPVAGTPAAATTPVADVRLEMTDDLRYIVSPGVVPSGPRIWEIVNTGTMHSHHVVMSKYPDGTTAADIIADFASLYSGTPPAGEPLVAQSAPVAYAALQSGGFTTWNEFNLAPGLSYAIVCFIINVETGVPHVMDGMVTVFDVQ